MAAEMSEANQKWISTQYVANRVKRRQHNLKWQHVTCCRAIATTVLLFIH